MLYKVFLIYFALTQICGTSLDSNGEVRQNITLEKCKILQIQMIEWRRDSLIIMTIIIAIFLFFMIVLILYCCSKREFFRNRE